MDAIVRIETKLSALEASQKALMQVATAILGEKKGNEYGRGRGYSHDHDRDHDHDHDRNCTEKLPVALTPAEHAPLTPEQAIDIDVLRRMTPRQHAVAQLIMRGWRNEDIGKIMGISVNTVKQHVKVLMDKMGIRSRGVMSVRVAAAIKAMDEGDYKVASGGLPPDWWKTPHRVESWAQLPKVDPYYRIYGRGEAGKGDT